MAHRKNGTARRSRRWYQLHKSTWIVLAVASILWAFIAVPRGQTPVTLPSYCFYGYPFVYRIGIENSIWPASPFSVDQLREYYRSQEIVIDNFLEDLEQRNASFQVFGSQLIPTERCELPYQREGFYYSGKYRFWSDPDRWDIFRQHHADRFFFVGLIADLAVYLFGLGIIGFAVETRRRRRGHAFQLTLFDLGMAFVFFSLFLAMYVNSEIQKRQSPDDIDCLVAAKVGIVTKRKLPIALARALDYPVAPYRRMTPSRNAQQTRTWLDWWERPTELSIDSGVDYDPENSKLMGALERVTATKGLEVWMNAASRRADTAMSEFMREFPNPHNVERLFWYNGTRNGTTTADRDRADAWLGRFTELRSASFYEVDFSGVDVFPTKLNRLLLEDCAGPEDQIRNWFQQLNGLHDLCFEYRYHEFKNPSLTFDQVVDFLPSQLSALTIWEHTPGLRDSHYDRINAMKAIGHCENLRWLDITLSFATGIRPDFSWLKKLKKIQNLRLHLPYRLDYRRFAMSEVSFPCDGFRCSQTVEISNARLDDAFVDWLLKNEPLGVRLKRCEISDRNAKRLSQAYSDSIFENCKFFIERPGDVDE